MDKIKTLLKCILVLCLSLNALSVSAAGQAAAFKDIELGSDISKIIQDKRFKCQRTDSAIAEQTCRLLARFEEELYDAPLLTLTLNYFSEKLSSIVITFENTHFNTIRKGLEEEYGPPRRRLVERYVTSRARVFKGYVYTWRNQACAIDAVEYFSSIGESAVLYKIEPDP